MLRHKLPRVTELVIAALCGASSSPALALIQPIISPSTLGRAITSFSPCVACSSSVLSIPDVDVSPITQDTSSTTRADFFEQQLAICKHIISMDDLQLVHGHHGSGVEKGKPRQKFREHPRCTARFGEVLLHARDGATSPDEYQIAVHNAKSIVKYVDACRAESNSKYPVRKGLVGDVAAALTGQPLRKFRISQIEDVSTSLKNNAAKADFTLENADLEIIGRLYYSAIRCNEWYLEEVGLIPDHGGFTTLLALCRAASFASSIGTETKSFPSPHPADLAMLSNQEAKLDAALSNHFNGITAPGCRFLFSCWHGIDQADTGDSGRAKHLIVAFSSLGNGLVRHEFGGSLAKLNKQLHADGKDTFDVLFVADPAQSWYQKDSRGHLDGFAEYEQRILIASRPYDKISLVGDSMGGSGALLFSHLATESVVAFSPQIDLNGDSHVSRYDMTPTIRDRYCDRLLHSVELAVEAGVKIYVNRGVEKADVGHTDLLMNHINGKFSEGPGPLGGRLIINEHSDCQHHQIAVHLKEKGQLAHVLSSNLIQGYR